MFIPVYAQEHNITASGLNTTINNESANRYNITNGKVEGQNIFHSFEKFNLAEGETAYFKNNLNLSSINNIISRVTGSASTIDGEINTRGDFPHANLFLINPKGIIFESNASLDIGGSFYASTADVLHFNADKIFYADSEKPIYLSSAEPSAFGFLDDVTTAIEVNGSELTVAPGKTLLFASGGIHFNGGSIKNNGGQIALLSRVDANGRIALDNYASKNFRDIGNITLKNNTEIKVQEAGGDIYLQGGALTLESDESFETTIIEAEVTEKSAKNASIHINVSGDITVGNDAIIKVRLDNGEGKLAKINIQAQRLIIRDGGQIAHFTDSLSPQESESGAIEIALTEQLSLTNGGEITSKTKTKVRAGDIIIKAENANILISGIGTGKPLPRPSQISSAASNGGIAGNIIITASSLELNESGRIKATVSGFGVRDEQGNSKAKAGDITLTLNALRISQGGSITNEIMSGNGAGGTIAITANNIDITGQGETQEDPFDAEINAETSILATGNAGDIVINAVQINLRNAGKILAGSRSIMPGALDNQNIAQSGNITINASKSFTMDDQSQVSVRTKGADAGDIMIRAGNLFRLNNDSTIITEVEKNTIAPSEEKGEGSGGNIVIQANNLFHLNDSTITTSVAEGQGRGGNITINDRVHKNLVITTGASKILATAKQGEGGNIDINAYSHLIFSDTVIDASSEQGIDGQVSIVTPDVDATTGLLALSELYLDVSSLLDNHCITRTASNQSRFVISSRDGLAPTPDTLLASRLSDFNIPTKVSHVEQQPMHGLRLSNLATPGHCL